MPSRSAAPPKPEMRELLAVRAAMSLALVLLHGFPASSHQYRNLIPALATRFHVIAPDYPGFGNSDMPAVGFSREPHRRQLRIRMARRNRPVVPILRQRTLGIR